MKKKILSAIVVAVFFGVSVFLVFFAPSSLLFNPAASETVITESDFKILGNEDGLISSFEDGDKQTEITSDTELSVSDIKDELSFNEDNDEDEAIKPYLEAANNNDADAQYAIGGMYFRGSGVKQNYNKALEWYLKAANQNHGKAQHNIGAIYYYGLGVEQDYKKSLEWTLKAANQGLIDSQFSAGRMYDLGRGTKQDYSKAFEWYLKVGRETDPNITRQTDHAEAQFNLGSMYYKGQGVTKDYEQALEWYKKAANQNYAKAQYNLGGMYAKGEGVEIDQRYALELLDKAAKQGLPEAIAMRKRIIDLSKEKEEREGWAFH